jgi:hypothetical protein
MNNGNCNINNGDDNFIGNPPPPTLEHVMAIQGQLFQTMVLMQSTILQMQSTDERTKSRKRKMIHRVMLAIWQTNGLRSNSRSLELHKLVMTSRHDPWVRWAPIILISLVLFHHLWLEGSNATLLVKKDINLKFAWSGIHIVLNASTMATIQETAQWRCLPLQS